MAKGKTRGKKPAPTDETKANRFVRLVRPRVNKAVKAISVIGYCSGSTYEYTPEQTQQILLTLRKAVDDVANRFATKAKQEAEFEFTE